MLKHNLTRTTIIWTLAVLLLASCTRTQFTGFEGNGMEASYSVRAQRLDMEAVDSYPQTIVGVSSGDPPYSLELEISLDPDRIVPVQFQPYDYPPEVTIYLEPTGLIQSDVEEICDLAERLAAVDDIAGYAAEAAKWTSENITYDNDLARQIWNGEVDTQSALETLERKKGTCSEYTNLFIAMLRCKGIPARFVHGYLYGGSYHAWAEFYLEGSGWIPVDPQMGRVGATNRHVKLFAGQDFAEIGVKLKEIRAQVK